jgi:hypothetical protein
MPPAACRFLGLVGGSRRYSGRSTATRVWNPTPTQPSRPAPRSPTPASRGTPTTEPEPGPRTRRTPPQRAASNTTAAPRRQRPRDRLPREAQPVSDRSLRQPLRHMKATDLRPLLHSDHPPNFGSGGPQLAERHWSPLQRASTAGDRVRRAAQNRNRTRGLRCRLPLPPMRGKVQSAG